MEKETTIKKPAKNLNKAAYIIFIAAGIGFLVAKDLSQAVVFWGLALVFDPFNINQPFQKRPLYQRGWLIVHLAITLTLFVLLLMGK
jgi:hypothetical protein